MRKPYKTPRNYTPEDPTLRVEDEITITLPTEEFMRGDFSNAFLKDASRALYKDGKLVRKVEKKIGKS